MKGKVEASANRALPVADLPGPDVVSVDLLGQFVIRGVETALISGGVKGGGIVTTGVIQPPPVLLI